MVRVNGPVLAALKRYDSCLFIKWNNEGNYFEVWRKMPWGNRLITPITESIYDPKGNLVFTSLDSRILKWIYDADSTKIKNRKWIANKNHNKNIENRRKKYSRENLNAAKDVYNLIHTDLLSAHGNIGDSEDWIKPDVNTCRNRTFVRSSKNAKKYFEGGK
jgi:hypothetical protein